MGENGSTVHTDSAHGWSTVRSMAEFPAQFAKILRVANMVVRPLVQSRLHGIVSGRLMLLAYRGGRTARRYTFPIGYFEWDAGDVLAFSSRRWPVSIRSAHEVRLLIRGRWHDAVPIVVSAQHDKATLLTEFAGRNGPRAARGLMLGLPGSRQPTQKEVLAAAAKTTIVRFTLTD